MVDKVIFSGVTKMSKNDMEPSGQTLGHGDNADCSTPELLKTEQQYLKEVLTKCKYPAWALDRISPHFPQT